MLQYRDFVPELSVITPDGQEIYASFDDAVRAARAWLASNPVRVLQIETVVLPNIWKEGEGGPSDPSLKTSPRSTWHQFVRVWFDDEQGSGPYR
jgi:hypothetical protein